MKIAFHKKLPKVSVEAQRANTIKEVPDERCCYTHGVGAETIQAVIVKVTNRPGPHHLYLGADARVLGNNLQEVGDALKALTAVDVTVIDLTNTKDKTVTDLLLTARKAFHWNGNRRRQKSNGGKGGTEKGVMASKRRNALIDDGIAMRICSHPKLTWKDREDILGMNKSTLTRHYI